MGSSRAEPDDGSLISRRRRTGSRSVLNHPDWVHIDDWVGRDLIDGRPRMLPGGFQFEPDGPSVYRRALLRPEHSPSDARKREDAYVFEFGVGVVREFSGFDVVHDPQSEDEDRIGYAHSLVVYKTMPMDPSDRACKSTFKNMRTRIMQTAEAVVVPPRAS